MDIQSIVDQVNQKTLEKLNSSGISPEDIHECGQFIQDFTRIASTMLENEPGIPVNGPDNVLPMDEKMITQALQLFAEGLYFSLMKCVNNGVKGQLRGEIMQGLAMEIYNQCKQVVVATYGQENTPDFQFSDEQQIDMVTKAADVYLIDCISEYEQKYGPINPESNSDPPRDEFPEPVLPAAKEIVTVEEAEEQPPPPASPPTKDSPTPVITEEEKNQKNTKNKYGAVALLLTKLSAKQKMHFLQQFSTEEKEIIEHYRNNLELIQQELNLSVVQDQLQQLHNIFRAHQKNIQKKPGNKIRKLISTAPKEKALHILQAERPNIKQYIEQQYAPPSKTGVKTANITVLPDSVLDILHQHLLQNL